MAAAFAICLGARAASNDWMVVDLRTGALSYYGYNFTTATNTFNTSLYKTEKMVFRRIPQGWYWIQNGEQHAFMQNDYYIAIFPCTVGQYAIILDKTAAVDPTDEENLKPKGSIAWFDWEGEWYIDWATKELPIKTGDPVSPTIWGIYYTSENAMYAFEELILGHDESLRGKYVVDMPTSSMWEVAARAIAAGDDTHKTWPWFFGETVDDFDLYAWRSKAKTVNDEPFPVMPVGLLRPNAWGLFDVYGNVGEWTSDGIGVPYGVPSPYDDYHDEEVTVEVANSYPIRFSQWPCHDVSNKEMDHYRMKRLCCGGSSDFSDGHDYVDRINSSYRRIEEKDIRYHYIGTRIAIVCKGEGAAAPVTITWKDYQGNTIKIDTNATFGQVPEYDGPTPTKPSTVVSNYTFAGWTPTPTYAVSNTTYTARFAESLNSYDIHWLNYDGTGIYTGKGWYGKIPEFYASTPVRPSTAQYNYEFTGWYPEPVAATCETSYTAQFRPSLREYYVSWENYNGTELKSTWVYYGTMPEAVYDLAAPTRPDDEQYAYTFSGWTPSEPVTSNTTYTAVYTPGPRAAYDIAWLNYDGSTNATSRTPYNTTPEFEGETPTKPAEVQYVYSFAGWTPELELATSNAAYTATFDATLREYTISWQKWDGTELFTTNVPYGSTPVYLGATPTQPSTAQYDYTFFGWDREIEPVTEATTYRAMFTGVLRSYDIIWVNYDGTVLCVTNVPYGTTPAYNGATPTKPQTVTSQFAFTGWTETVVSVTGAATYTAAYTETPRPYPVTWLNYDGTVLCVTNVPYGEIPAYLGATPRKESAYRCHYDFSGWTPELAAVTEAGATYTATFNEVVDLLAHLTFDDYGNDGLNVLKATFGEDGIVRTTQANVVEGLGSVTPVTDAAILAGLPEGDGAVAIPVNTHIALPIPATLASESGKPWSISMKVKFPSFGRYYSVFTMPAANNSDMMVYLRNLSTPTIALKQEGGRVDGSGGFTAGQWETLLFLFDSGRTRVLLNGKPIFSYAYTLAGSRADCANAGGYILLAGDEDGEDSFMYWADVRVYDGIVDDTRGWDHATVTWRNYDGTLLATEEVSCGVTPVFKGAKPGKPTSLPSYFVFSGWTEEVVPVTGDVTYTAKYTENTFPQGNTWMVVDLPTGDATYFGGDLGDATNAFNTSEFKTTKMVFRRVPEGFYWCRGGEHVSSVEQAIMGRPYYIGMFPVTEAQYTLMLDPTATVTPNATNLRPQANVSYSDLRGSAEVPSAFGEGLADGPIYRLNAHVQDALGAFDLPTVAMWEVASRAMPSGDDSHKDWPYTFDVSSYDNLYKYAWFYGTMNVDDGYGNMTGRRVVGTKLPNDWGLYDMPGNVWDWCLDNYSDKISRSQTPRKTSGNVQLMGGSYAQNYHRNYVYSQAEKQPMTTDENVGFRLAMISDELPTYTITWRDYDGTVLATDKFARSLEGVTPTYSGRFPKKPGHYFTGWSPAVATVEADAVYTATYQPLESGQSLADLSTLAANYTAQDGDVLIDKTTYTVSIADGATVTLAEMSSPGLTCLGSATIVIADNTVSTLSDTLRAGGTNTTLTIQGNTGTLTANGGSNNAGIGGKGQACGNIRIEGGIINATGGFNAAGIGPYYNNNHVLPCGDITITGGTITAVGNGYAAGIGASDTAPCGKILISGGFVTATGGSAGPGIGGPTAFSDSVCESITISGGTVYATGFATTYYNRSAIGWNCGDICIDATIAKVVASVAGGTPISSNNGTVTIAESLKQTVEGNTLTIENLPSYDITWLDEDGTLLATGKAFEGDIPVYGGATPIKGRYIFTDWMPTVVPADSDATYTAFYGKNAACLPDDYKEAGWTLDGISFRSKTIGDNGLTEVCLNVTGPGSLTFNWKVSSEENYDFLRFYRGDSQLASISGETDWIFVSNRVDAAGMVTFKWAYSKDRSKAVGSDCGWIKDIVWIPDAQGTQVFVNGTSVEFERGEDGKTLTTEVPAGTLATDVPVKVAGVDVSRGFSRKVEGTIFTATLLAPYEVPKEAGVPDGMWTENGDGTVTLNVTVVPGLYYAADSAESIDALACPGASAPATGATTLTAPKPVGDKGFFKVWVSDAPIPAKP